jgi:hypothetical protein
MAKKGGPIQLQVEVNTNDDWQKMLVEKKGLVGKKGYSFSMKRRNLFP